MTPATTIERAKALIGRMRYAPPMFAMHREAFAARLSAVLHLACHLSRPANILAPYVGDTISVTEDWGRTLCDDAIAIIDGGVHQPIAHNELDWRAQTLLIAAAASTPTTIREAFIAYVVGILSMMGHISHAQPFYRKHLGSSGSVYLGLAEPVTMPWAQAVTDDALRILRGSP